MQEFSNFEYMKRKVFALILLFIFLHGSLGFSLTRHYCTHSGEEIYALGNAVNHACEKESEEASCCAKPEFEEPVDCCNKNGSSSQNTCTVNPHQADTDDCCTNQQTYFHIERSVIKTNPSLQIALPIVHLMAEIHSFVFISQPSISKHSTCCEIPPLLSSLHQPAFLCVFRI